MNRLTSTRLADHA